MGDVVDDGEDACLGEWRGKGKTFKIHRGPSRELIVEMGAGGHSLLLVAADDERQWPKKWAVVRRVGSSSSMAASSAVYIFELQRAASPVLLVRKPSGEGAVEFARIGQPAEPSGPGRPPAEPDEDARREQGEAPTRSASSPDSGGEGALSFADSLAMMVSEKKVVHTEREKLVSQWLEYESKLLDRGLELFKQRCRVAAQMQKCATTISFEQLSREIEGFPKRSLRGSTYYVGEWGEGMSAERWFYSSRSVQATFPEGVPILFAEVLQVMLAKFLERVKTLGFTTCTHEVGTWKIHVSWPRPEDEDEEKEGSPGPRSGPVGRRRGDLGSGGDCPSGFGVAC